VGAKARLWRALGGATAGIRDTKPGILAVEDV